MRNSKLQSLFFSQIFKGNNDSNGIVKHDLAVPRITSSILLIPRNWTDNIGLRMEIYGCEPSEKVL